MADGGEVVFGAWARADLGPGSTQREIVIIRMERKYRVPSQRLEIAEEERLGRNFKPAGRGGELVATAVGVRTRGSRGA